jgi:hypothetical protein
MCSRERVSLEGLCYFQGMATKGSTSFPEKEKKTTT